MIPELDIGCSALLTDLATCINHYRLSSPGLYCCVHASVQLGDGTRIVPGVLVMVNFGEHEQCDPGPEYACFEGPPNFVVDAFPAGESSAYGDRRDTFERAGVLEYVAFRDTQPLEWTWNRLVHGHFVEVEPDDSGTIRSSALPGLWIPAAPLRERNWWAVIASIAQGVTRREHHEFMHAIWHA